MVIMRFENFTRLCIKVRLLSEWRFSHCLYHRTNEVSAVLTRPRCSAEYPSERGRKGCGCHIQNFSVSTWQKHLNLYCMNTVNLMAWLPLSIVMWLMYLWKYLFVVIFVYIFRLREFLLRKAVQFRPVVLWVRRRVVIFKQLMQPNLFVLFSLAWRGSFSLFPWAAVLKETVQTKWTPQKVRNTKHQPMSAMVCARTSHCLSVFSTSCFW